MDDIIKHFKNGFKNAESKRSSQRRIGAELKFPVVDEKGSAVGKESIKDLWKFLNKKGWEINKDPVTKEVVGAVKPGPLNDTLASCETGYCKVEFSLAHVADIHELIDMIVNLRKQLQEFSDQTGNYFLGYGIHPVTPPSKMLKMNKARNIFWDKIFAANNYIPPEVGDDVHLFTVSASSQVHLDVSMEEAVKAVNVFNGFSGAQLALSANSNIWKGRLDKEHRCVGERFWDWWDPEEFRYGIPPKRFDSLDDYIRTVAEMSPVYVERDGVPIGMHHYDTFKEYYKDAEEPHGITPEGEKVPLTPEKQDIDQHSTFYWYNARISRYYTLENRMNDQQPPEDLHVIAALSLGIVSALNEAEEVVKAHNWNHIRKARVEACKKAMEAKNSPIPIIQFIWELLNISEKGLKQRGLGEEIYLEPLKQRVKMKLCPADEAEKIYHKQGIPGLVEERKL